MLDLCVFLCVLLNTIFSSVFEFWISRQDSHTKDLITAAKIFGSL